jgi:TonB family protein
MKVPKDRPFLASVGLHLVILVGFLIFTILQAFWPKEKIHVFEVIDLPNTDSSSQKTDLPAKKVPNLPEVAVSKPVPKPQPLISAKEFYEKNPKSDPKPREVKRNVEIALQQIKVRDLDIKTNTPDDRQKQLTDQQNSALSRYMGRLVANIDAAWTKPAELEGINLIARVLFNVSSSGLLSNPRLTKSSGNAAFDRSIISAFKLANTIGPTPTGQGYQYALDFTTDK